MKTQRQAACNDYYHHLHEDLNLALLVRWFVYMCDSGEEVEDEIQ